MRTIKPYLLLQIFLGLTLLLVTGSALIRFKTSAAHSELETLNEAKIDRLTTEYLKPENRSKLRTLLETTHQTQRELVTLRHSGERTVLYLFCYSILISGVGVGVYLKALRPDKA